MKRLLLLFITIALASAPLMFLSCEDFFFPETPNNSDDTEDETTIPDTPSALSVDSISSATLNPSIVLEWTDNSDDETGFTIERSTSTDFSSAESFSADTNDTEYLDKTIAEDTEYYYRIAAKNSAGSSDWVSSSAITFAYDAPAAPSGLSATKTGTTSCNLSWTDNSYCENGFTIEYSENENFTTFSTEPADADATSASLSGLTPEGYYYIRVLAYNDTGDSDYSDVEEVDLSATAPDSPSGLMVEQASNTSCTVSWMDNSTNETGFKIQYRTDDTITTPITITVAAETDSTLISGLTENTTYYFQVCATNNGSDSAYTDPVSVALVSEVPNTLNIVFEDGVEHGDREKIYTIWISWIDDNDTSDVSDDLEVFENIYVCTHIRLQDLSGTALPYWQENIRSQTDNVDAVSGSTIFDGDFTESRTLTDLPEEFTVWFEIDHSRDGNDWFSDQPAILYKVVVDQSIEDTVFDSEFIAWTPNEYTEYGGAYNNIPDMNEAVGVGDIQYETRYITNQRTGDDFNEDLDDEPATDLVGDLYVTLTTE